MRTVPRPDGLRWRKSSHSGDQGASCVEIAELPAGIAVRDSKNPEGPAFTVSAAAFSAFVSHLKENA